MLLFNSSTVNWILFNKGFSVGIYQIKLSAYIYVRSISKIINIKQCFSGISAAIEALIVLLFPVHLPFQPDQILVCRMILGRTEIFMKIKVFLIVRIRLKKDISL